MHGRRPTMTSRHGMVAAAHPLAAQAGARVLAQGGNAFDAAAATAAALNVVEPFMSGLAGHGLATMWVAAEQRVRVLDFVPPVPRASRPSASASAPTSSAGALAVARPRQSRRLVRARASAMAASRCRCLRAGDRSGAGRFRAGRVRRRGVQGARPAAEDLSALYRRGPRNYHARWRDAAIGLVLAQPDLARTLSEIAAEGTRSSLPRRAGRGVVAHLQALGGCMTMADLAAVTPSGASRCRASYRGLSVHVPPPSCEGFQFLLTLRLLDGFDLAALRTQRAGSSRPRLPRDPPRRRRAHRPQQSDPGEACRDARRRPVEQLRTRLTTAAR